MQIRPSDLNAWLLNRGWCYRRNSDGAFRASQDQIDEGVLTHKTAVTPDALGRRHAFDYCRVTQKGLVTLAKLLVSGAGFPAASSLHQNLNAA